MPWIIFLYAIFVIVGGLMGYFKAQSQASLISGTLSGLALFMAAGLSVQNRPAGLALAACLAAALTIVFSLRFYKTRKLMPSGLLASLSGLACILFLISLIQ